MTAGAAALGFLAYEAESTFGENVSTFTTGISTLAPVDTSGLSHAKVAAGRTVQFLQGGDPHISTVMGGSFKTKHYLCGHGSATSGSMSLTDVPTLLGIILGASSASASGTTFTGGTATAPTTTSSGTFAAGALVRAGTGVAGSTASDTRGSGQVAAISTHATTTLNLLTALPGAPNNADVLHSAEMVYITEAAATAITGTRWLLQSANLEYECHGCYPTAIAINGLGPDGSLPSFDVTWGVSWFKYSTATFPSATSPQKFLPAPSGGANYSFFFQTQGTATRSTRTVRSMSISINLGVTPIMGPGGTNQYQVIVGATRTPSSIAWEWVEDAPAATTSPQLETDWTTTMHGLLTLSATAGSAMGIYSPKLCPMDSKPVQFNDGGLNRVRYRYAAYAGDTTTTDLTASAIRFGFA